MSRPVLMALDASPFDGVCEHEDEADVAFKDHLPKMWSGGWRGALGGNVGGTEGVLGVCRE